MEYMEDIIFFPKNTFIKQCCYNCNSLMFNCVKIPIYTTGMYYSVNVCNDIKCIQRCIRDLDIYFYVNKNIYLIFHNKFIDFLKEGDLIKVNVPRTNGNISSWYCYGCKPDFSSFLVYENLSSSSLSKSVKYEKLLELNDDDTLAILKNMKINIIDNLKLDILKYDKNMYNEYNTSLFFKNKHNIIMKNLKNELEYLPFIGIKYIDEFETIHKPRHNYIMNNIITEIEHLPSFSNFIGGIKYLQAKEFFDIYK